MTPFATPLPVDAYVRQAGLGFTAKKNAPMVSMEAVAVTDVRVPMTVHVMQLLGSVSVQLDLLDQGVKLRVQVGSTVATVTGRATVSTALDATGSPEIVCVCLDSAENVAIRPAQKIAGVRTVRCHANVSMATNATGRTVSVLATPGGKVTCVIKFVLVVTMATNASQNVGAMTPSPVIM